MFGSSRSPTPAAPAAPARLPRLSRHRLPRPWAAPTPAPHGPHPGGPSTHVAGSPQPGIRRAAGNHRERSQGQEELLEPMRGRAREEMLMEMGSRSSEEGSGAGGTGRSESSRLLRGVCPVPGARGGWMWAHGFARLSPGDGAARAQEAPGSCSECKSCALTCVRSPCPLCHPSSVRATLDGGFQPSPTTSSPPAPALTCSLSLGLGQLQTCWGQSRRSRQSPHSLRNPKEPPRLGKPHWEHKEPWGCERGAAPSSVHQAPSLAAGL